DGWAIDSSATDRVVAVKGGGTYTTGGATAGTWTISGLTENSMNAHSHTLQDSAEDVFGSPNLDVGDYISIDDGTLRGVGTGGINTYKEVDIVTDTAAAHAHTISSDATWRVSAAVFTMQYLDM
ncbi:MAG: hypothetical protein ACYS17_16365, partial [Planctomycetota bacterium]